VLYYLYHEKHAKSMWFKKSFIIENNNKYEGVIKERARELNFEASPVGEAVAPQIDINRYNYKMRCD